MQPINGSRSKASYRVRAWIDVDGRSRIHRRSECNYFTIVTSYLLRHPSHSCHIRALHPALMSSAAKLTLAGTTLSAIGVVLFVHWQQTADKAVRWLSLYPTTHPIWGNAVTNGGYGRQCTKVLFATWSNSASSANDNWILKCSGSWRRSIGRCRMSARVQMDRRWKDPMKETCMARSQLCVRVC